MSNPAVAFFAKLAAAPAPAPAPAPMRPGRWGWLSPTLKTLGGAGAGAGLSAIEENMNPHMTGTGKEVNRGINVLMGSLMANPAVRRSALFSSKMDGPHGPVYGADPRKWVTTSSLWGAKALGINTWDKLNQSLGNIADSTRQIGNMVESAREPLDQANTGLLRLMDNKEGPIAKLEGVLDRANAMASDPNSPVQKGVESVDRGARALETFSKPVDWLMNHKKEIGYGALGVGSAIGGFMLLRDYLNRKKQRDAQVPQAGVPKTAAPAWLSPIVSGLVGGGAGYAFNQDPNDPTAKYLGAGVGAAGSTLANIIGRGRPIGQRMAITSGGFLGADILGPQIVNTLRASRKNDSAQAALAAAQMKNIEAMANKPAPSPTMIQTSPEDSKTTLGLTPGTMLGMGALGAGGLWLMSKLMEKNKTERIPAAGGGMTSPVAAEAGAAPGVAPGPEGAQPGPAALGLGTLRVTLPTKKPGDQETMIEMPLEQIKLPNTIISKLRRDTKRRLRTEGAERTHSRIMLNPAAV